jgi:hypothetical protein
MSATMTTVNGMLKEVYEGGIRNQLQESAVAIKRIVKSSDGVFETAGGKYVVFPVRKGRNHGISYRAENTQLAAAGRQSYAQTQEQLKYGYGRARFTGQVMELAKSNPQAFANAVDQEMDGLKSDVLKDQNRIVWGNKEGYSETSGTGVISVVTTGATSTTITAPTYGQIESGMVIDLVDNTGTPITNGTGRTVASVASDELSFVIDVSVTTTTSATYITRTGNWNQEPLGFTALVGTTGTIHNINSGTAGNEYWQAAADDSSTTVLTENAMTTKCDLIRRKTGNHPTVVFASLGVRRAYANLMTSLRRYNEPKEWVGGLVGLAFNYEKEIPVVTDIDCPANSMYIMDEKEFSVYRNQDWYFANDDGSVLKWVHDYDAWEALLKCYWQLVTHKRGAAARFTALTEG